MRTTSSLLVLALGAALVPAVVAPAAADRADRADRPGSSSVTTVAGATDGPVVVVDPLPEELPPTARRFVPRAPYPLTETFALHSSPGASRVVHLDFDGATVTGTEWNEGDAPFPSGFHAGWDTDGDPTTFSAGERTAIQEIWARVAEDYAPFRVDVTTEDPGPAAIRRSGPDDTAYGMTALVTDSDAAWAWCDRECGGVAYLDVFDVVDGGRLRPAWIFPGGVQDHPGRIAEAVSHEVGHTLGLEHDGRGSEEYYEGHASWGPIMGAPYTRTVTQWSDGSYPGATQRQDDVSVVAASGAPLRADEGSALPTGTAYVTTRTDTDAYELGACAGNVTVTVRPAAVGPDLDPRVALVDPAGVEVASADPLGPAAATLTSPVTGSGWQVVVDGVGAPSLGYDDYGSIGAYTLTVAGCDGSTPDPGPQPEPEPEPELEPVVLERPGAVARPTVQAGAKGGAATAALRWLAPADDGGAPVAAYQVLAYRVKGSKVLQTVRSETLTVTAATFEAAAGSRWRFAVRARNSEGWGPVGPRSATVRVR
ncbi:hypothetical protein QWY28_06030 [Nocardioides sp. SOB77]|uniref:Fibronectin type-III domain-containing protein n=1 Tax=Nocardioides oceani TaxID=3058369 RepID=A0ABT8FDB8_9ACTN|nr:hypothetical protein [Nocardioides oceani]MDN4172494.1 hypothetical protein [Nocardioides oceani]